MSEIRGFQGEYRFLSNFWPSPIKIGITYPTAEHLYQAFKCEDASGVWQILACPTPGEAKRVGRTVSIRLGWEDTKKRAMEICTYQKFFQNPELMEKLLDTQGQLLIESNTWHDNYWGECICTKCAGREKFNYLGQTLMQVRDLVIEKTEIDF